MDSVTKSKIKFISKQSIPNFYISQATATLQPQSKVQGVKFRGFSGGLDPVETERKAFFELVERLSSHISAYDNSASHQYLSVIEMKDKGLPFLYPECFVQHQPFYDRERLYELPISWVRGHQLITEQDVYVPCLSAYYMWKPQSNEPIFSRPDTCGLATHVDQDKSTHNGLLEVLERDALILSWRCSSRPIKSIDTSCINNNLKALILGLECVPTLYSIGAPGMPWVVLAIISNCKFNITIGHSSSEDLDIAVSKSLCEALMVRPSDDLGYSGKCFAYNSREKINRGYYRDGKKVVDWYDFVSCGSVNSSNRCKLDFSAIEEEFECEPVSVPLLMDNKGWNTSRSIIINACQKEDSDIRPNTSVRLEKFAQKSDYVNALPHPFG